MPANARLPAAPAGVDSDALEQFFAVHGARLPQNTPLAIPGLPSPLTKSPTAISHKATEHEGVHDHSTPSHPNWSASIPVATPHADAPRKPNSPVSPTALDEAVLVEKSAAATAISRCGQKTKNPARVGFLRGNSTSTSRAKNLPLSATEIVLSDRHWEEDVAHFAFGLAGSEAVISVNFLISSLSNVFTSQP